jgi:hypothetical protein
MNKPFMDYIATILEDCEEEFGDEAEIIDGTTRMNDNTLMISTDENHVYTLTIEQLS